MKLKKPLERTSSTFQLVLEELVMKATNICSDDGMKKVSSHVKLSAALFVILLQKKRQTKHSISQILVIVA